MRRRWPYRILLRWYPRTFRARHGDDLCRFLDRQRVEPRYRSLGGGSRFLLDATVDAARAGLRLRVAEWRERLQRRRPRRVMTRGDGWLMGWARDTRLAVRGLRRAPLYTGVAVLTLALGIGATTSIFSVVYGVVMRPLPYTEPDRLYHLWVTSPDEARSSVAAIDLEFWARELTAFNAIGGYAEQSAVLAAEEQGRGGEQLHGARVSAGLFRVLDVTTHLGRWFTDDEDVRGGPHAVVLHHDLWRNRFGGDTAMVGRRLVLDGVPRTVVGVMPAGFYFPDRTAQFWTPLRGDEVLREAGIANPSRGLQFIDVVGRLASEVSQEEAGRDLAAVNDRLNEIDPVENAPGTSIEPMHEVVLGDTRATLFLFLGAVALVLMTACANVANLALARASSRGREFAVRAALGAGRAQLMRLVLAESTVLAVLAGAVGLAVATGATRVLVALGGDIIPRTGDIRIDGIVILFSAGIALGSGLLFGVLPATHATRRGPAHALREGFRGSTSGRGQRTRHVLVVVQVALSVVLLVGAALLTESFVRLTAVDPGFDPNNVVVARVGLGGPSYEADDAVLGFFDRVVERVRALPGVVSAGTSYSAPFMESNFVITVETEDHPVVDRADRPWVGSVLVDHDYFQASGVSLLRGRSFTPGDRAGPRVAVVNETMARRLWPNRDPVGARFRITGGIRGTVESLERRFFSVDWFTVIGVARDVRRRALTETPIAEFYQPHAQMAWPSMSLVVRTGQPPAAYGARLREVVAEIDPNLAVTDVATLRDLVRDSIARPRFQTWLFVAFGLIAVVLAMIGVYGVMAYAVVQRRHEIGIRMALGARQGRVVHEVLRSGFRLTVIGIGAGIVVAFLSSRVVEALLFEASGRNPVVYVAIAAVVTVVSVLACVLPARAASRVSPLQVLRTE